MHSNKEVRFFRPFFSKNLIFNFKTLEMSLPHHAFRLFVTDYYFFSKRAKSALLTLALLLIGYSSLAQFNYDVSRAAYTGFNDRFFVGSEETNPLALTFNPTGTKMYVLGTSGDDVNQYTLSTAFDVSTASFDNVTFSIRDQEGNPYSLVFNNDGTKMYVLGISNDNVNQYSLTAPYNIATASYDGDGERFSVATQESVPTDISFNADGTKMFILGYGTNYIHQYTLSPAYDVSMAIYDGDAERFFVGSQEPLPASMRFNNDGTQMYVLGFSGDDINQYTLSVAYDVSTATFDGNEERKSVASEDTNPFAMTFNADGSKMFMMGTINDAIFEYTLTDVAPIIDGTVAGQLVNDRSTIAPFAEIIVEEGNSQDVSATITLDDNAKGVLSGADLMGTGPYTIAANSPALLQSTLRNLQFDPTDDRVSGGATETTTFTVEVSDGSNSVIDSNTTTITTTVPSVSSIVVAGTPDPFDATVDFTVTFRENVTGVDITDFTLNTSAQVSATLTGVTGVDDVYTVTVSSISGHGILSVDLLSSGTGIQDGASNAIAGGFEGNIHVVGFAFDLVNGAYAGDEERLLVGEQEFTPHEIVFVNNGFKMFLLGSNGDDINQYNLSTAYDVSTAVFDVSAGTFSVRAQDSNPYGMAFNNDGTKMFIVGDNDFVYQYSLSIPFDIFSAVYDGDAERFSVSAQETVPTDLAFNPDGTKLFVLGLAGDDISQYTLASPFDVSTAVFDGNSERLAVGSQESNPRSFVFAFNGKKIYLVGNSGDDVNSYTLSTPYDVSTAVFDGNDQRLFLNSLDGNPFGLAFNPDGTKLFVLGDVNDAIFEFLLFDVAPEISGAIIDQEVNDRSTVAPFEEIVITEQNNQNVSATITLDNNAKGVLSGAGLTGTGPYTIATTSDEDLQATLRALLFDPSDDRVISGSPETTIFTLAINDGTFITSDNTTTTTTITDPKVLSITLIGDPGPADTEVDFLVTFAEDVTGVDISDFTLNISENVTANLTGFSGNGAEYTLSVQNISGAGVVDIDFASSETGVQDLAANAIVGGFDNGEILYTDYSYDVSNAIYEGDEERLFVRNQEGDPQSMLFNPNGTRMFIMGRSSDAIHQYTLTEAYDVSTAIYDNILFSVRTNTNEFNPTGMAFNSDGTKMFVIGTSRDQIFQYTLASPYDISVVTYDGINEAFSVSSQEANPTDIVFNRYGTKLFVLGESGDDISQYTLTNPFDVSTAVYDGDMESFPVGGQESQPQSIAFNLDGTKMYIAGRSGDDVNSYTLSSPYDVSTADFDGNNERYNFRDQGSFSSFCLAFKPDGTKMYMIDTSTDFIYEYNILNEAPEINNPLVRVEAFEDSNFDFDVPTNTFSDQNQSTFFTYEANLEGGGDFPVWLTYDEVNNTFSGTPTNDDVSVFKVELTATDDLGLSVTDVFELEVVNTNDPPSLAPIADQSTDEGLALSFFGFVSDIDVGDTFTWSVDAASTDKGIIAFENGEISWKPGEDYDGPNTVTVIVTDAGGLSASQTLTITVNEANNAPTITPVRDREIIAPTTLTFTVGAVDGDPVPQIIAYSLDATSVAKGMTIDAVTGVFSWTVDSDDVGFHEVTVEVTDGESPATETFTIRVRQSNVAPVLGAIGNQTIGATETLSFTATATDANPDESLEFSLSGSPVPNGISFNQSTGEFSWTPLVDQAGSYELTISVSDGLASDSETFNIEVSEQPLSVDQDLNPEVRIYPNPVQQNLQFEFEADGLGNLLLQLVNLNGQIVWEHKIYKEKQKISLSLDLSELTNGLYVLETRLNDSPVEKVNVLKID